MKKILALILVCVCALQMGVFAAEFKDMPDDWSTAALETAVKNGLLTGSDGYIKASDNMTRAEMATIMVRACGATRTADISNFTDVAQDDWFYDAMSKAVAMGAFKGSDNKLNPNDPITRQEAFVVLSRVFGVADGSVIDPTVLIDFKDQSKIDSWAMREVAAIVDKGYVAGSDGYINPLNNISRAEFAVVMDRMIKYYIDDAAAALPADGNVMIRANGVDLSEYKTDKVVILGDAVTDENIKIKKAELTGKFVIRGGKNISAGGSYNEIAVLSPGIYISSGVSNIKRLHICKDSTFDSSPLFNESDEEADTKDESATPETEKDAPVEEDKDVPAPEAKDEK